MSNPQRQWEKQQRKQLLKAIEYYGSQAALASALELGSPQVVSNWVLRGRISATMAEKLEKITDGKFRKRELRPDVHKWWSESHD